MKTIAETFAGSHVENRWTSESKCSISIAKMVINSSRVEFRFSIYRTVNASLVKRCRNWKGVKSRLREYHQPSETHWTKKTILPPWQSTCVYVCNEHTANCRLTQSSCHKVYANININFSVYTRICFLWCNICFTELQQGTKNHDAQLWKIYSDVSQKTSLLCLAITLTYTNHFR